MAIAEVISSFLTRRFFGALTGGFFFDVHHSLLVNTIHFYFWLFLFIFPLSLFSAGVDHYFTIIFYPILTGVLFFLIKFSNFYLHKSFDKEQKAKEAKTSENHNVDTPKDSIKDEEEEIKDSKREEPISTDDITIVEDAPRLTFQEPPATTIPEKKPETPTIARSDESKRRDKRHKIEDESDDSTTVVHSSLTATRKSKTSTGAVLGERDSEISSTLDKETSVPWLTEEDTSMKEFSEEDLSDNEPKASHSVEKEHKNTTATTTSVQTTTTNTTTTTTTENPFVEGSNLLDDIRNYAFDDFAFYDESAFVQMSRRPAPPILDSRADDSSEDNSENKVETKQEKKPEPKQKKPDTIVSILGKTVALPFDRLFLNQLLDRDDHWFEALLSVAMATTCSYLGFKLSPFFHEFALVMLWYIVGCAQYSLLKSPQPDSCSPRHDFNKLTAYNRSFYFILIAMSILLLNDSLNHYDNSIFKMYNIEFSVHRATEISLSVLLSVLPYFPLIYLFGLLPQCNTLVMYVIEQLNIHAFGGSGSSNIRATLFDFFRSWLIVGIIYGIGYASKLERNFFFSLYLGVMVGLSLLHSRLVTDPIQLWNLTTSTMGGLIYLNAKHEVSLTTPAPQSDSPAAALSNYPKKRLIADLVLALVTAIIATAIHATTVFYYLWPYTFYALAIMGCFIGFLNRYIFQVLRKPFPWNLFQEPILESIEHKMFEPKDAPSSIMWYEKIYMVFNTSEQIIFYPILFLTSITHGVETLTSKFSLEISVLLTSIIGVKLFRGSFGDVSKHYIILFFTLLFFQFDLRMHQETFMIDFFFAAILVTKIDEAILKMNFILVYLSLVKMSWGSVAHVIMQPLAVPHFVVTLFQVIASSVISAPLYPFVGSTVFLTGYGRPMRFWEREYKTNRVDNSQIKLSEALDNNSESEVNANNLNSIFYEHMVSSLQKSLYKEIQSGRFGTVSSGDFYILVNDRLTAMLHIIDISNGHCTFQLRGMEFKGTYCQERELEAINRQDYTQGNDNKLFPNQIGKLPKLLSFTDMLGFRWRSWEVVNTSLMLQTYSIGLNAASTLTNVYSLRMVLIKCYVKAAIYYLLESPTLESWLSDPVISSHLTSIKQDYADMDPIFTSQIDEDFDLRRDGISIHSFDKIYGAWIQYCLAKRIEKSKESISLKEEDYKVGTKLFNFCFAISLLARRCLLVGPSDSTSSYTFMNRFHSLFKGDFRITSTKDEFILADPDIMHKVLGKAIRISLRLHQDYFIGEEYEDPETLFQGIEEHERTLVCCHEGDPLWRSSILNDVPHLLSLRKQTDSTAADYNDHMILSLTLRYMKFRVIKLNREGVRGLWAGQVQELVFLGNTNAERGSIQQLRTVVRNLINQSCDFPVGYPIYVSPLTTSYSSFWPDILTGVYYPSFLSSIWAKGHL